MSKKEKVFIGIDKNLETFTVEIPETDPKPWDGKSDLKYIGKRIPRIDGKFKTSGRAKYTFDIKLPGMLYGKIIRSKYPAALVTRIDISRAQKAPGVRAIVNLHDELPFAVRFAGQEIIALAAETAQQADKAAQLVDITYQIKPFVVDLDQAMEKQAPAVFDEIKLADENHIDFDSDEMLTLINNVNSPYFGINFDTGNFMRVLDDPVQGMEKLAKHVYATHIKDLILAKSQGNPFFIEEMVRALIEAGLIYRQDDVWRAGEAIETTVVPQSVQSVILSRVDHLAETAVLGKTLQSNLFDGLRSHYIAPVRIRRRNTVASFDEVSAKKQGQTRFPSYLATLASVPVFRARYFQHR